MYPQPSVPLPLWKNVISCGQYKSNKKDLGPVGKIAPLPFHLFCFLPVPSLYPFLIIVSGFSCMIWYCYRFKLVWIELEKAKNIKKESVSGEWRVARWREWLLRDEALNDGDVGRAHAVRSVISCGEWGVLGVAFSPHRHFPIPGFLKATATGRGTFLVPVILLLCTILTLFDRSSPHPPSLSLVFALLYCSKPRSIM